MPTLPNLYAYLQQIAVPTAPERTALTPAEESLFQQWAATQGIRDVDAPDSFYDYRGYWKDIARAGNDATKQYADGLHFTDAYKQHGHPTFSVESIYSKGPFDGGRWIGESYVPQGADLLSSTRRPTVAASAIAQALQGLLTTMAARNK